MDVITVLVPCTDPTLTVDNVNRVISETVKNWDDGVYAYGLAGELLVPLTVQESIKKQYTSMELQKKALVNYWINFLFNASWATLAGALYFLDEKAALKICVKEFLQMDQGIHVIQML